MRTISWISSTVFGVSTTDARVLVPGGERERIAPLAQLGLAVDHALGAERVREVAERLRRQRRGRHRAHRSNRTPRPTGPARGSRASASTAALCGWTRPRRRAMFGEASLNGGGVTMAEVELMALYWTVAGPADVHTGREWSTFDWRDRCEQAAKVGFKGIGLWHADIEHQLETRTLREMKQIFDDAGLEVPPGRVPRRLLGARGRSAARRLRRAAQAAVRRRRRVRRPPHQGRATSPARRPRSRSSPRRSPSCVRTRRTTPAAWTSSTSSCRST